MEVQGQAKIVDLFIADLPRLSPPLAVITKINLRSIKLAGESEFAILASEEGEPAAQVAPDGGVCPDCLRELFDPSDRRYRYPFINCTNCGPRYSIITATPYDRKSTTMASFAMCPACRKEYEDPSNRRFHAQPNACPVCGPRLSLLDPNGEEIAGDPLLTAIDLLRQGKIVALKGLGGFHLAVDACNSQAVAELRRRKRRDEKPFAIMAADITKAASFALLEETEERLLSSPENPIVILRQRPQVTLLSPLIAPNNRYLGVMLPYTPLQHLLLDNTFEALVMTSGNVSDEPIAFDNEEALRRLAVIADAFLIHDRDIRTRCDDSVVRVFAGGALLLRRSRGYVPRAVPLLTPQKPALAMGGELKASFCLTTGRLAYLSQHIGDLTDAVTLDSLGSIVSHLESLLQVSPELIAHDLHPDYLSTIYATELSQLPKFPVQHHHAHMASCMAEHHLEGPVIGIIFDGSGYGMDGTVWGGEFLVGDYASFERVGHLAAVPMPGGDLAVRQPFRMAFGYLHKSFGNTLDLLPLQCLQHPNDSEKRLILKMLDRRVNTPLTSSCGRLFDAVAAIIGVQNIISFEGQAAMELESLAEHGSSKKLYPFETEKRHGKLVLDFSPMVRSICEEMLMNHAPQKSQIARQFHSTLACGTLEICQKIGEMTGIRRVVLSGGVFQNRLLTEELLGLLAKANFQAYTHRLTPPNDGGLSLGQAVIAARRAEI